MVRFGIIGAGVISKKHAEGIAKVPNAEIAAVCDLQTRSSSLSAHLETAKKVLTPL